MNENFPAADRLENRFIMLTPRPVTKPIIAPRIAPQNAGGAEQPKNPACHPLHPC